MRCPSCGSFEPDDAIVCSKCGNELPFDQPADTGNNTGYNPYSSNSGNNSYNTGNAGYNPYSTYNANNNSYNANTNPYNAGNTYGNNSSDPYGNYNPSMDATYNNSAASYKKNSTGAGLPKILTSLVGLLIVVVIGYLSIMNTGLLGMKQGTYYNTVTQNGAKVTFKLTVQKGHKMKIGIDSYDGNGMLTEQDKETLDQLKAFLEDQTMEYVLDGKKLKVDSKEVGSYDWFNKKVELEVDGLTLKFKYKD